MIDIFNNDNGHIESFQSYDGLLKYIKEIEKEKFIETGKRGWDFTIHSRKTLASFYWYAIKALDILLTEKEQEAYENGLNLLEMCRGDENNLVQVILTPNVNIREIMKDWCLEYCSSNGFTLIETRQ
jgi:hypothetical protein